MTLVAGALPGVPEVAPGDDLAEMLTTARGGTFAPGEVLVVAQKVVSKAEGAVRRLADVVPGAHALALAVSLDKDPHMVQVVLDESSEVVRASGGVLITRTHHGFVCANAGVDRSNAGGDGLAVLLPRDPDASARALRAVLPGRPAVVVADSFGRAWRVGQTEVALGCAGLAPLDDWAGRVDADGRPLQATAIAVADQAAAAADLVRAKDSREPAVVLTGLERFVTVEDGPGAAALLRDRAADLFGAP